MRLDAREREERQHEAQYAHRRDAPRREDCRAAGAVSRLVARQREHTAAQDERDDGGDEPEDAEASLRAGDVGRCSWHDRRGGLDRRCGLVRCGSAHGTTVPRRVDRIMILHRPALRQSVMHYFECR